MGTDWQTVWGNPLGWLFCIFLVVIVTGVLYIKIHQTVQLKLHFVVKIRVVLCKLTSIKLFFLKPAELIPVLIISPILIGNYNGFHSLFVEWGSPWQYLLSHRYVPDSALRALCGLSCLTHQQPHVTSIATSERREPRHWEVPCLRAGDL